MNLKQLKQIPKIYFFLIAGFTLSSILQFLFDVTYIVLALTGLALGVVFYSIWNMIKDWIDSYRLRRRWYRVRGGQHKSRLIAWPWLSKDVDFRWKVRLTEIGLPRSFHGETMINKILGISFGWNHHRDSMRLGFSVNKLMQITLYTYSYREGKREYHVIPLKYNLGDEIIVHLHRSKQFPKLYLMDIYDSEGKMVQMAHSFKTNARWGFKLNPYIGGSETLYGSTIMKIEHT